jgi:hypothetical protein
MDAMFDFWVGMFLECFVAELDLLLPWTIIWWHEPYSGYPSHPGGGSDSALWSGFLSTYLS